MVKTSRNTAPAPAGNPLNQASRVSASSRASDSPREEPGVFFVGSGDCAALVDHIEVLESEPSSAQDAPVAGDRFPDVARRFRDRVVNQQTGRPLVVRLDRRLFLPESAERRKRIEDRIRAMHGTRLHDGRTLHVDEVLGRYDQLFGGLDRQLSEVRDRLVQGQLVRLAVSVKILNDDLYRRLGILSQRFGDRLNLSLDREMDEKHAFHDRVALEASGVHIGDIRQRLTAGQRLVLRVDPAAVTPHLRREIKALQRDHGDQLTVEAKRFRGQADLAIVADRRAARDPGDLEDGRLGLADIPFSEVHDSPAEHEDRTMWAREVAARVRKPWWRRFGWPRKAKRGVQRVE